MRPTSDNLRHELRSVVKEAVWFLMSNHTPGSKRDICLFCTRRGGSTFAMETIAANRGVKFLDQPFEIATASLTSAQFRAIPKFDGGQVIHLEEDTEKRLRRYIDRVLSGALPVNAPWRFWRKGFPFRSDRLVLKTVATKAIIDWVDANFDVDIVLVTRHPISQSLSCMRNGWTLTAAAYLRNDWFVSTQLRAGDAEYCWDVLRDGTQLEQFVLNWALENLVPLRLLPDRPHWTYVSYEAWVLEAEAVVRGLADALALEDVDSMLAVARRPSRSSGKSTDERRAQIIAGDRSALVAGWRKQVSGDEERSAMAILERLGIDLYRHGEVAPTPLFRFAERPAHKSPPPG